MQHDDSLSIRLLHRPYFFRYKKKLREGYSQRKRQFAKGRCNSQAS